MSSINEKAFKTLYLDIASLKKGDSQDKFNKVRNQILDCSPDVNALTLAKTFNLALKQAKTHFEKSLLIDTQHINNLIQLRSAAIFFQSLLLDLIDNPAHTYIDLTLYHKARYLALKETNFTHRQLYRCYFNEEILKPLSQLKPELKKDELEEELIAINPNDTIQASEQLH